MMSRHPKRDTTIEQSVRQLLYRKGLRYRIHLPVPGMRRRTIDIAFPGVKVAVFVDGCFWHGCPVHGTTPRSNTQWWAAKLRRNAARDLDTAHHLQQAGWSVLRFWAHEDVEAVAARVAVEVRRRRSERSTRPPTEAGSPWDSNSFAIGPSH
jgi:DNA mismatch endonuclease (patch repair protein)